MAVKYILKFIRHCVFALGLCSLLCAADHHGLVKFGGLPVPGATVTATQAAQRFTTTTDPQGAYSFTGLADGAWTIRVEMLCFAPIERDVAVAPAALASEWELKPLPFSEIQAAAPPPPQAAPTSAASQAPLARKARRPKSSEPRPANTPTAFQQADLNPSADTSKPDNADDPGDPGQTPSDGFLINGSVNNGSASPFGQASAFGNNRRKYPLYRGSLGLIFDNSLWDARAFSLTGQDTPKPAYTHAQALVSFGGPLNLPWLTQRSSPYVTLNYQWARNRNATTDTARVPTLAERRGDFSQSFDAQGRPVVVIDPDSGSPFAGNAVPTSRLSRQAAALLPIYPEPNFDAGTRYNYQVPLVGSSHQDSLQSHVNKWLGSGIGSLAGQFSLESTRTDSTNLFGFLDTTGLLGTNASANWSRDLPGHAFVTIGYQFSRLSSRFTPYFAGRQNVSNLAGITGNNQEPANWGPPALVFSSGIASLSDVQSSLNRNQTSGVSASLFQARGPHNITIGTDFRRQQFNLLSQQDPRGVFTFTGAAAGSDFAGFLLGIPDTASIAFGNADKYLRASSYESYFTDDWHVGAAVTINAGLRWGYSTPVSERYGRLVNLDTAPGFAAIAPVVSATPDGALTGRRFPDSLIEPYRRAVQPRIGIAWRPLPASSLVIRAGYGVYYDSSIYLPIATRMAQQSPLSMSLSIENSAVHPLSLRDGFHAPPDVATNTFAVDPYFRPGYAQTWQFSIQHNLPGSLVSTATYLGTKGTHAQQQFLPNTYPAGSENPCPACPAGYVYLTSNGNSTRQSGRFQLRRRLHSGVGAQLSYTWSKSIDDAALGGAGAVIAQDWLMLNAERGLSNFDQRHTFSALLQFTSGMGLGGGTLVGGWRGGLFKDWTLATQVTGGSGLPITPVYMTAVSGTGVTGSIRPDYTGPALYGAPPGLFLNPAAVAAPAPGRWGNAGRNSITGPGQFGVNASLGRTFRLGDRISADFRVDSLNALNHVTFSSWNAIATSAQFGLPTSAKPMRSLQTSMRVRF